MREHSPSWLEQNKGCLIALGVVAVGAAVMTLKAYFEMERFMEELRQQPPPHSDRFTELPPLSASDY